MSTTVKEFESRVKAVVEEMSSLMMLMNEVLDTELSEKEWRDQLSEVNTFAITLSNHEDYLAENNLLKENREG